MTEPEENIHLLNGVNRQSPEFNKKSPECTSPDDTYEVWVRQNPAGTNGNAKDHVTEQEPTQTESRRQSPVSPGCSKQKALHSRKETIVEWQIIATVLDRLLFWIFLLGTIGSFIVIILVAPKTKVAKDVALHTITVHPTG